MFVFHKAATRLGCGRIFTHFYCKFHLLSSSDKNFENRLRFGKVIAKIQHHIFLRHSICIFTFRKDCVKSVWFFSGDGCSSMLIYSQTLARFIFDWQRNCETFVTAGMSYAQTKDTAADGWYNSHCILHTTATVYIHCISLKGGSSLVMVTLEKLRFL